MDSKLDIWILTFLISQVINNLSSSTRTFILARIFYFRRNRKYWGGGGAIPSLAPMVPTSMTQYIELHWTRCTHTAGTAPTFSVRPKKDILSAAQKGLDTWCIAFPTPI